MRSDTGQVVKLEDYRPSDYLIPTTHLAFDLAPDRTRVVATLEIERREGAPDDAPLVLDGDGLDLTALSIDGEAAPEEAYEAEPDRLTIARPPRSRRFELTIETELAPARNEALMGLYRSNGVYCSQCEAEGFRRITYFLDRPDILSVYTVRIEADQKEAPLLLSNGNPVEAGTLKKGRHFAVWHDPFAKPSYLFALVAGDLGAVRDRFKTGSGKTVDLAIFVEHGKEPRAAYAMDSLKRSMRWDEEVFGCEYDLDVFNIVAVSDFNMGAMENKGLNIFNDKYILADEETATDADFANIEAIVAHEYFHNWTGNRITCRDWFQLCLKEGLTVFRDHEFSADQRSRAVRRITDVRTLKTHQFPEDQGPLAHPVRPRRYREINNFYTATVYEKGAEVVRMIRTIVGEAKFRQSIRLYLERHDGSAATIEDFLKAFEDAAHADLSQFSLWYHQAGTPNLTVGSRYDEKARELVLEIEQTVPPTPSESRKRLMHIPLAFGLVGADGSECGYETVEGAGVSGGVIHVRKRKHTVRFKGLAEKPAVSLNRGFSAPVTLSTEQTADDRYFLARHDDDAYARWQQLNGLFTETLIAAFKRLRGGKEPKIPQRLAGLAGDFASDTALEPAYRALALTLPSESDTAREIGSNIDPDAIHKARNMLAAGIATENAERFALLHEELESGPRFTADAESAGRRSLRNVALDYLSVVEGSPDRAERQYRAATNMTDRAAALTVLAHRFAGNGVANDALSDFETRYRGDALVMDKWFAIQAAVPGRPTVDAVRALMKHPAFSIANPNRVRALVGSFASANQTGFHAPDGSGYALFAEVVLSLDTRNPQVAARLATALRSWRSLEPERQAAARETMVRMSEEKSLSTDLRDIIDRVLS